MSQDNILSVDHLAMRFGGVVAVNDLSFTAERRRILAPYYEQIKRKFSQLRHCV